MVLVVLLQIGAKDLTVVGVLIVVVLLKHSCLVVCVSLFLVLMIFSC